MIKNGFERAYLVPYPVSDVQGKNLTLDQRLRVTFHTSHVTRHTSHVTRHTSDDRYNCNGRWPIQQDEDVRDYSMFRV